MFWSLESSRVLPRFITSLDPSIGGVNDALYFTRSVFFGGFQNDAAFEGQSRILNERLRHANLLSAGKSSKHNFNFPNLLRKLLYYTIKLKTFWGDSLANRLRSLKINMEPKIHPIKKEIHLVKEFAHIGYLDVPFET